MSNDMRPTKTQQMQVCTPSEWAPIANEWTNPTKATTKKNECNGHQKAVNQNYNGRGVSPVPIACTAVNLSICSKLPSLMIK